MTEKIYQVCVFPKQIDNCVYTPFLNSPPEKPNLRYLFFESEVMRQLIRDNLHKDCDFFGVLSNNFESKIIECTKWGKTLKNKSKNTTIRYNKNKLSKFLIGKRECDIVALTTHTKHSTFKFADKYHPNISEIAQLIVNKLGFDIDVKRVNDRVIYFNYFLAKPEIYEDYIKTWLAPAMNIMLLNDNIKNMCLQDAKYKPLPKHLEEVYDIKYYPYFPFIAERLITLYVNYNKLNFASW